MGDSGFKLQDSQNVVFADNIMVGQMVSGLKENEVVLGTKDQASRSTSSGPVAAKINGISGIKVTFPTKNADSLSFALDPETVEDGFIDKIGDKLSDSISDSLVDKVIAELEINPNFAIKKAFKTISFSDVIVCEGLFTSSNIQTGSCGTEICRVSITPENTSSMFMIFANLLCSRREGTIVLANFQEGDTKPRNLSFGYSNGNPNCCCLNSVVISTKRNPLSFSFRVGGLESGPVIINGLPNGDKIFGMDVYSTISILEVSSTQ